MVKPLPVEAQFSTVNGILTNDFDGDGLNDILLAGNLYVSEVETGRADAGIGLFLQGNGDNSFDPQTVVRSGFFADKDVKCLAILRTENEPLIVVANNNDVLQLFSTKPSTNEKIALR